VENFFDLLSETGSFGCLSRIGPDSDLSELVI